MHALLRNTNTGTEAWFAGIARTTEPPGIAVKTIASLKEERKLTT
jgi:hypothetical protein